MSSAAGNTQDKKDPSALAAVRDLAIIAAVYLFFATYIYTQSFYSVFGLRVAPGELPLQTIVAFSYFVLKPYWFWLLIACPIVAGIVHVIPVSGFRVGVLVFLGLLLFGIVGAIAARRGRHDALSARQGINCPIVTLSMKAEGKDKLAGELAQLNADRKLRLLLETKDDLYVFAQEPDEFGELPYGRVFSFKKAEIAFTVTDAPSVRTAR